MAQYQRERVWIDRRIRENRETFAEEHLFDSDEDKHDDSENEEQTIEVKEEAK